MSSKDSHESRSSTADTATPPVPGIVGIGASAGGISALERFFQDVPETSGIAFVVILHLPPEGESDLAAVLEHQIRLPVTQVRERTRIEPDHVYVIPPARKMSVVDGHLEVSEFDEPQGRRVPIDSFFMTLAEVHPDSVGVLLSGSGSDGVVGLTAIKERGGLIMAQLPAEAEYDTMPLAAITTGLVDMVLPARELGARVVELRSAAAARVEELRRSEERFRALIRATAEIVWVADPEGLVGEDSPSWRGFTGQSEEERRGRGWLDAVHPEDRVFAEAQWKRAVETKAALDTRLRLWNAPGEEWRVTAMRAVPVRNPGGAVREWVAMNIDITEREKLEERFRQSLKMEAIGRLAAGVAHDFNNVLTAIAGNAEIMVADLPEASPLRNEAREVLEGVRRATSLTGQLLAFSRKQATEKRPLDLSEVVADVEPMVRRIIPSRIELRIRGVEEGVYGVRADADQLQQVILNLVMNAEQAIEGPGVVEIRLDTRTLSEPDVRKINWHARPGRYARLTVSDTGVGIPEQVRERIFEPFFTTKPLGEGTGLGLATVLGTVKQSGGHVFVESEPGHGSAFEILLPLMDEIPAAGKRKATERKEAGVEEPGGETVLLVEDEASVRDVARRSLERAGYTVLEAQAGQEALDTLERRPGEVGVVVSDLVMPGMNGAELLERLGESHPGIKVVLMSGYSDELLAGDAGRMAAAFLGKPFTPRELVRVVRDVLSGSDRDALSG